jgi:hypothetical protein
MGRRRDARPRAPCPKRAGRDHGVRAGRRGPTPTACRTAPSVTLSPAVDLFGTVLIVVSLIAVVVAAVSYLGSGRVYSGIGRGDLSMERERASAVPAPTSEPEAIEEIRQLLEAKSARLQARGEAPLDIESELAALTSGSPQHDPALREEVRQHVIARNARLRRQGKEPLDVEAEVDRQLRALGG